MKLQLYCHNLNHIENLWSVAKIKLYVGDKQYICKVDQCATEPSEGKGKDKKKQKKKQ